MALTAIGIGVAAVGTAVSVSAAHSAASAQQGIAQAQAKQNKVRQQAMELDAHRRQLEVVRNAQVARSTAVSNATAQNAQGGSGLPGGEAQISGQAGNTILGINQNLQFGEKLFSLDNAISNYRFSLAGASATAAFGSGLTSFGGSLINASGAFNRLTNAGTTSNGGVYTSPYTSPQAYAYNSYGNGGIY